MLNKIKQAVSTAKEVVVIAPRMLANDKFYTGVNKVLSEIHQAAKVRHNSMADLKAAFNKEKANINALYRDSARKAKKEFLVLSKEVFFEEKAKRKKALRKKAVKKTVKKAKKGLKKLVPAFN